MEEEFYEYIRDVKKQLVCNTPPGNYVLYNYSNEFIDSNLDYFEKCMIDDLSPYKALLYFEFYLKD